MTTSFSLIFTAVFITRHISLYKYGFWWCIAWNSTANARVSDSFIVFFFFFFFYWEENVGDTIIRQRFGIRVFFTYLNDFKSFSFHSRLFACFPNKSWVENRIFLKWKQCTDDKANTFGVYPKSIFSLTNLANITFLVRILHGCSTTKYRKSRWKKCDVFSILKISYYKRMCRTSVILKYFYTSLSFA